MDRYIRKNDMEERQARISKSEYRNKGKGILKSCMKNLFYSAADGRRQKLDSILYRLPTWHPIYSMPFGQSKNLIYSPVRAEYLIGGNVAGYQNAIHSSALVRICRAIAGGKIKENRGYAFDKPASAGRQAMGDINHYSLFTIHYSLSSSKG